MRAQKTDKRQLASPRLFPLFSTLSDKALDALETRCHVLELKRGARLLSPGDQATGVYFLLEGAMRVLVEGDDEGEAQMLVRLFTAPAFFGENEILTGTTFLEEVDAIDNVRLLWMPSAVFSELLEQEPGFARCILKDVSERFRSAYVNQSYARSQSVEVRLAALLLNYGEAIGIERPNGMEIDRRGMTYAYLGQCISATGKSVQRTIDVWRRKEYIARAPGLWRYNPIALNEIAGPERPRLHHRCGANDSLHPL